MQYTSSGFKIGSLHYWAKEDNKKLYLDTFCDLKLEKIIHDLLEREDNGMTEIYREFFSDELVCVNTNGEGKFYIYNKKECLWILSAKCDVQKHFGDSMPSVLERLLKKCKQIYDDEDKRRALSKTIKEKIKLVQSARYQRNVFELIKSNFKNEDFENKLDSQRELISIQDGVVNLRTGEFRQRVRSDCLSYQLDIKWCTSGLETNTQLIDEFISGIMLCNQELIEYLHRLLGYMITGEIKEQIFLIFWGEGSNGKSVLMSLMEKVLKQLYAQTSAELIIGNKKNSNKDSPNSSLMSLTKKRLAVVDESDKMERLSEGVVKNLTG